MMCVRAKITLFCFAAIASFAMAGCGLGGDKDDAPLPGERKPLLQIPQTLSVNGQNHGAVVLTDAKFLDWPQDGGGAAHYPSHPDLANDFNMSSPKWSVSIGAPSDQRAPLIARPVIARAKIFTMDPQGLVRSYDAQSGKLLWSSNTHPKSEGRAGSLVSGSISYNDGKLYVTTGAALVVALDAKNGDQVWSANLPAPSRAAPTAYKDKVFVTTLDARVIALASDDGSKIWEYQGLIPDLTLLASPSVAAAGGVVMASLAGGEILAMNADDGTGLWANSMTSSSDSVSPTGRISDIAAPLVMAGGDLNYVIAIGSSGSLVAMKGENGAGVWSKPVSGINMPWLSGKTLFVLGNGGVMAAFDAKDGKTLWARNLPTLSSSDKKTSISWYGPVLAGGKLFVISSDGVLSSFNAIDGQPAGSVDIGSSVSRPPVAAGGRLYLLTDSSHLFAY